MSARRTHGILPAGFGVYIHYPQCARRCGYCDFATVVDAAFPQQRYADAVITEARGRAEQYRRWPMQTIYFGGGSPSLWSPDEVARVIGCLQELFPEASAPEITLEANPQDISLQMLAALRDAGINRLSVGVQSLDDAALSQLTRRHDAQSARQAVLTARRAGFENMSCDIICGIPGETVGHHLEQLAAVCALKPPHLSVYSLTLERRSALFRQGLRPLADDGMADLLEAGRDALELAGYAQYEVSNYAQPKFESRHNLMVWRGRPYLGLGASAHSMVFAGLGDESHTIRVANPAYRTYMEAAVEDSSLGPMVAGAQADRVGVDAARHEMMMLGLRTKSGVDRASYRCRFGCDPMNHFGRKIEELVAEGLLRVEGQWIAPTQRGMLFADTLALRLAP